MIKQNIRKLAKGMDLTHHEAMESMKEIMSGEATESQIGAFLTAMTVKGETIQEISAFATAMREFAKGYERDAKREVSRDPYEE